MLAMQTPHALISISFLLINKKKKKKEKCISLLCILFPRKSYRWIPQRYPHLNFPRSCSTFSNSSPILPPHRLCAQTMTISTSIASTLILSTVLLSIIPPTKGTWVKSMPFCWSPDCRRAGSWLTQWEISSAKKMFDEFPDRTCFCGMPLLYVIRDTICLLKRWKHIQECKWLGWPPMAVLLLCSKLAWPCLRSWWVREYMVRYLVSGF